MQATQPKTTGVAAMLAYRGMPGLVLAASNGVGSRDRDWDLALVTHWHGATGAVTTGIVRPPQCGRRYQLIIRPITKYKEIQLEEERGTCL